MTECDYSLIDDVDWGCPIRWDHPLNRGLVSWWLAVPNRMGWKTFTWRDLCNRNHGTLTGMTPATAWGVASRKGGWGRLGFAGTTNYVDAPYSATLVPSQGLAVSVWLKTTVADKFVFDFSSLSLVEGYFVAGTSGSRIQLSVNGISSPNSGFVVTTGQWCHFVGVWVPSTRITTYVNGLQNTETTTSVPASITSPALSFRIGGRHNGGDLWNGSLDCVRIYSRAISAHEVADLYLRESNYYDGLLNRPGPAWWAQQGGFNPAWACGSNQLIYPGAF